jgi:hypothetical protein
VNKFVAFLRLKNLTTEAQTASVRLDIDGRADPYLLEQAVPACGAVVLGVHALPGFPADANYGVTVRWPSDGSAGLVIRSLSSFWNPASTLVPPVDRVR